MPRLRALAAMGLALLLASACNAMATDPNAVLGAPAGASLLPHTARSPRLESPGPARIKAADCDGDGGLNSMEVGAFVYAYVGLSDGFFAPMSGQAFEEADTNKDYKLSEAELNAFLAAKATGGWEFYPIDCKSSVLISK